MATYAIGDVQGSFDELQALLGAFAFDRAQDRLWLVGDLVNRGPASLATLRFVRDLGDRAVSVLGNHDLHLLALAQGSAKAREEDTLGEVIAAPDRDGLLDWLRHRPMVRVASNYVLVHAGLLPQWDVATAKAPAGYLPWFEVPGRKSVDHTLVCGHWSALGLRIATNLLALDSGCVWGGKLSAVRLEDRRLYQVPCAKDAARATSPAGRARPGPGR